MHTLLVRDHGLRASYDTLWRFATQQLGWRKKTETVRVDDPPPGQEAQVDFGEMGRLVDNETGKRRVLWVLIVTLSFSRLQFVWPTFRQTTEAVCEALSPTPNFLIFPIFLSILSLSALPPGRHARGGDTDRPPLLTVPPFNSVESRY